MLIPLGRHCNISVLNSKLCIKKETGVFEWFESKNLQCITDVINTLTENPNKDVIYDNGQYIYIFNTNLYSYHYNLDEYKAIFERRYNRFINIINKEENIYFVRINTINCNITQTELELFIESIKKINSFNTITFLLIDTIYNDCDINPITINIDNVVFHHKYFYQNDIGNDENNPIICEIYKKMLEDIGYNVNDQSNIEFTDKSEI